MSAAISANQVKELREKTGAGMMECKKALAEANGDFEAAVKVLRESGLAKAAKREGRTAAEGLVGIETNADQTAAAVVELNSETDFVARNEEFQNVRKALAKAALAAKANSVDALYAVALPEFGGQKAGDVVQALLAKIGEKIQVSRVAYVTGEYVVGYIHPPGKIGTAVVVKLNGAKKDAVTETLKGVAMHVAAASPRFTRDSEVDQATLDSEREIYANIARNEGKKEELISKIVEGKVKSFYAENCLLNQKHVMDPNATVKQVVDAAGKQAGGAVELVSFVRFKVGETAGPKAEG